MTIFGVQKNTSPLSAWPNPAVERDCAKARSPSLLRYAALNPTELKRHASLIKVG